MSSIFHNPQREDVRNITGSPVFELSIPATNQNIRWTVNLDTATPTNGTAGQLRKYLPFNFIKIINNSGQTIQFFSNQSLDNSRNIYSGQVIQISNEPMTCFFIVPTSGNVSADTVKVNVQRAEITSDRFALALSKNVFVRALLGV